MFAHHQKYSYERRDKPARSRSWLRYQPTEMVVVSDVTIKFNVITPQGGHGFAMNVVSDVVSDVMLKFIVMNVVSDVVSDVIIKFNVSDTL